MSVYLSDLAASHTRSMTSVYDYGNADEQQHWLYDPSELEGLLRQPLSSRLQQLSSSSIICITLRISGSFSHIQSVLTVRYRSFFPIRLCRKRAQLAIRPQSGRKLRNGNKASQATQLLLADSMAHATIAILRLCYNANKAFPAPQSFEHNQTKRIG